MSEKDVVENVDSPGAISIPTASNSAKGIASFNAKDFTVNNGEVSAIWERGVPQYVGIIVGQEEGEGDLTWTVDAASLVDNRPVKIGEYIMLREDAFGFARGEVFVITGISADENFLVITDNQSVFSLQGEVGPKGDKGGNELYLHSLYFPGVKNTPLLTFYHTSVTKVTDEWIYNNLTESTYCLTFYPTVTAIYQYGGIGLSAPLKQTSSSPSWGANIDLRSSGATTLSVSQAEYNVTKV